MNLSTGLYVIYSLYVTRPYIMAALSAQRTATSEENMRRHDNATHTKEKTGVAKSHNTTEVFPGHQQRWAWTKGLMHIFTMTSD